MARVIKRLTLKLDMALALKFALAFHITESLQSIEISIAQRVSAEVQLIPGISPKENDKVHGILYDVTTGYRGDYNYYNRSLYYKSPLVYIEVNENTFNDTCWLNKIDGVKLKCGSNFGITSLSLLIPQEQIPHVGNWITRPMNITNVLKLIEKNTSVLDSIIFSVDSGGCHMQSAKFSRYYEILEQSYGLFQRHKIGLEYDEKLIDGCVELTFFMLPKMDLAVLRVEISPFTSLLSYGLFCDKLDALVEKNVKFLRNLTPECAMYIRLVLSHFTNVSDPVNNRYRALIWKYVHAWQEEHKLSEIAFIVSSFPEDVRVEDNIEYLKTSVGPTIILSLCATAPMTWMKGMPIFFTNVLVNVFDCNNVPTDFSTWISSILAPISSYTQANMSMFFRFSDFKRLPINLLRQLASDNAHRHLNIQTIYLSASLSSDHESELNDIVKLLQTRNIEIGCFFPVALENVGEKLRRQDKSIFAAPLLNVSSKIMFLDFYYPLNSEQDLVEYLWKVDYATRFLRATFPDKEPIPCIQLHPQNTEASYLSAFCYKYKRDYNEQYNAIATFAAVQGWSSLHLRVLDGWYYTRYTEKHKNWWQTVATTEDVNRSITDFSLGNVFVHTNIAKQMAHENQLPNTYPCVIFTAEAPKEGIGFLRNSYSGATMSMNLRGGGSLLNVRELETLLLFAFGKFPTVELVATHEMDVLIAAEVLNSISLLKLVSRENNSMVLPKSHPVYLELPLDFVYHPATASLSNLPANVPLHFSGWENQEMLINSTFNTNLAILAKSHFIGITVANCVDQVNLNLTRLTALSFLPLVSYIVCNVPSVVPGIYKQIWMDRYLSTMFYLKSLLERIVPERMPHVPKLEVIFRLNFKHVGGGCSNKEDNVEQMLRFLNNVNQHSALYEIRYFIVNAFGSRESSQDDDCPNNWWRIENYTDLSNSSVYTDIEEEHFGRPTSLKFQLPLNTDTNGPQSSSSNVISVVIIIVLLFVLFTSAISFWLYHKHMSKQILTQKEINAFHNGVLDDDDNDEDQHKETCKWLGMGFPIDLQISKRRIEIGNLIGSGEFGTIFLGLLDGETQVAVKEPKPNASSETFKSVLSEVKILCFVGDGSHQNVISFLGAYTKEIGRGKLYILTEYCHNGSLLGYLKAIRAETRRGINKQVDMYQMYRFAVEIASGMEYISKKGVIHGDLATRNILLNSNYTAKICDFGLSRQLYDYSKYVKKGRDPLPWRWMAVESLKDMEFTTKSDVWSYGVTIWEIFSLGAHPFPALAWTPGYVNDLTNGTRLPKADYATDIIHEKLLECWDVNPESRPTFAELVEFFGELKSSAYDQVNFNDAEQTESTV